MESTTYDEIIRIGEAKGLAKGKAEGEAVAVVRVLELRFGSVPEAIRTRVLSVTSRETLVPLLDLAVQASSLEDFVKRSG